MEQSSRRTVGLILLLSGAAMALVGIYFLLMTEMTIPGGAIFGAGILDLILGLFFLRG